MANVKGFTVMLDHDYNDEDAADIADAIGMIKGVAAVTGSACTSDDWMNRERVRQELGSKIVEILKTSR